MLIPVFLIEHVIHQNIVSLPVSIFGRLPPQPASSLHLTPFTCSPSDYPDWTHLLSPFLSSATSRYQIFTHHIFPLGLNSEELSRTRYLPESGLFTLTCVCLPDISKSLLLCFVFLKSLVWVFVDSLLVYGFQGFGEFLTLHQF